MRVTPVHIGQAQVQQDHVGAVGQGVHQSARAGFRPVEEIVLGLQGGGERLPTAVSSSTTKIWVCSWMVTSKGL